VRLDFSLEERKEKGRRALSNQLALHCRMQPASLFLIFFYLLAKPICGSSWPAQRLKISLPNFTNLTPRHRQKAPSRNKISYRLQARVFLDFAGSWNQRYQRAKRTNVCCQAMVRRHSSSAYPRSRFSSRAGFCGMGLDGSSWTSFAPDSANIALASFQCVSSRAR
jgi:hypothetical protein